MGGMAQPRSAVSPTDALADHSLECTVGSFGKSRRTRVQVCVRAFVCVRARVCARACVRACVCECACVHDDALRGSSWVRLGGRVGQRCVRDGGDGTPEAL